MLFLGAQEETQPRNISLRYAPRGMLLAMCIWSNAIKIGSSTLLGRWENLSPRKADHKADSPGSSDRACVGTALQASCFDSSNKTTVNCPGFPLMSRSFCQCTDFRGFLSASLALRLGPGAGPEAFGLSDDAGLYYVGTTLNLLNYRKADGDSYSRPRLR